MKVVYGYGGFYLPKEFIDTHDTSTFGGLWETEKFEMFTHPDLVKMVEDDNYTKRNGRRLYIAEIPDEVTDMWIEHYESYDEYYCVLNGKRVLLDDIMD